MLQVHPASLFKLSLRWQHNSALKPNCDRTFSPRGLPKQKDYRLTIALAQLYTIEIIDFRYLYLNHDTSFQMHYLSFKGYKT